MVQKYVCVYRVGDPDCKGVESGDAKITAKKFRYGFKPVSKTYQPSDPTQHPVQDTAE